MKRIAVAAAVTVAVAVATVGGYQAAQTSAPDRGWKIERAHPRPRVPVAAGSIAHNPAAAGFRSVDPLAPSQPPPARSFSP
jgi:hypothetical protein